MSSLPPLTPLPTQLQYFPTTACGIIPAAPCVGISLDHTKKTTRLLSCNLKISASRALEDFKSPLHLQLHNTPVCRVECISKSRIIEVNRKKLAVFVSGGGSNFKSILHACREGQINGDIVAVVTNNSECGGAQYARKEGIPVFIFPKSRKEPTGASASDLVSSMRSLEIDFIFLAGYLKLLPTELVEAFPRAIMNIHPSLLPSFGGKGFFGMNVHKAVIASGARYSGATVHFVDENFDTGRILAQRVVPVLDTDTAEDLAARVLKEVAVALCEDRVCWRDDGVPVIRNYD